MFSLDKANPCLDRLFWMLPAQLQKSNVMFETTRAGLSDFVGSPYIQWSGFWCVLSLYKMLSSTFHQ